MRACRFRPLLAGATFRGRMLAVLGILAAIAAMAWAANAIAPGSRSSLLVASMGASAVLLFAIPSSPLTQPWPVIGGSAVSALVGVAAHAIPVPWLGAGVAVAGAVVAMSLLRCLHPPGGGLALLYVLAPDERSFAYPLVPVALDAVILVALAWVFHRFSGHSYPHRPATDAKSQVDAFQRSDIDAALAASVESFDIDPADLDRLFERAARHADLRRADSALGSRRSSPVR